MEEAPEQENSGVESEEPFEEHEYMMNGIKVKFPFKAYPSQVVLMSKIIKSIQERKHALLESPTGTGKSLALLCAALAWQEHEKRRILRAEQANEDEWLEETTYTNCKGNNTLSKYILNREYRNRVCFFYYYRKRVL
jgi:hypothetical protein